MQDFLKGESPTLTQKRTFNVFQIARNREIKKNLIFQTLQVPS